MGLGLGGSGSGSGSELELGFTLVPLERKESRARRAAHLVRVGVRVRP